MLNVSIVIYKHIFSEVDKLIETLLKSEVVNRLYIIDNSPAPSCDFNIDGVKYIFTGKNLGYGAAHNIALRKSIKNNIPYHLVVNPDILLEIDVLKSIIDFMDENTDIGHVMPKVVYPNGEIQYLCKLLPTPADLIFRRFLPEKWTKKAWKDLKCVIQVMIKSWMYHIFQVVVCF